MEENNFEEMELRDIFMIVWKRKVLLAIVLIATVLIGVLATIVIPDKTYQSEINIELSGTKSPLNIGSSTEQSIQNMLNEMIKPLDMSFETYVEYITEDQVLEETIADLKLEDKYSIESLRSKLMIIPDEETQSINIKINSSSPEEPVKVLNALTENYVELVNEEAKKNSEEISKALKEQTEIEKEKYESTFETYESFINENKSVEEYEIERQAMYKQIIDFKTDLKNLEIKEKGTRAAIKEDAASGSPSSGSILETNNKSLYIGDAKQGLALKLSEIIAMKEETEKTINALEEEINQINIDYQRAEIEAISINQKLEISKESYESFARTYETIQTVGTFDKGKLGIAIPSKPKESIRIQTNTRLKLLMIIVLGFIFGVMATFIKEYLVLKKLRKTE